MNSDPGFVIVVQPSVDYAERILATGERAVFLVGPDRASDFRDFSTAVFPRELSVAASIQSLRKYVRSTGCTYSGLVCFVCERIGLASQLANAMSLRFHHPSVVHRSRNKDLAHARWVRSGVSTPATQRVVDEAHLLAFAETHSPPWVLKPCDGTGSAWVERVDSAEDLLPAYERLRRLRAEKEGAAPFMVQSLIQGRELSADFFVRQGELIPLRVTEKLMSGRLGEVSAYFPAVLNEGEQIELEAVLLDASKSLGQKDGLATADLILTRQGPYILELALRPGGDCLPDLCRAAHGYDPILETCRAARGLVARSERPYVDAVEYAAIHLISNQAGVIDSISFDALMADPAVVSFEPYLFAGDTIVSNSGCYEDRVVGSCLIRVDSADDLLLRIPELVESVLIETRLTESQTVAVP